MAGWAGEIPGGTRASRGRRPKVVWRGGPRSYLLLIPGLRLTLVWLPWSGYRLEAWAKIVGGQVVRYGYYTY